MPTQFNSLGQMTPNYRVYDHVGNILPDVEHSEGERPACEFRPAAWLPVQFKDKYYENWIVIPAGKIVALDPHNRVMPAQYGLTSASVTYSANDVIAGTIDITTGIAVTTAKTVTLSTIDGSSVHFMGREGEAFADATKKYPIGVAAYAFLQWAGDGSLTDDGFNPAAFRHYNYNMQHQVTVLCDYVLKLPYIPGQAATESIDNTWTGSAIAAGGSGGWRTRANCQAFARYDETNGLYPVLDSYPVIGWAVLNYPVAKNTSRSTITSTLTTLLVNEVDSVDLIRSSGDWWMDYELGILFVYSADGQTLPAIAGHTITYYHYKAAPTVVSSFASVVAGTTELKGGDMLKCDSNSNFTRANPAVDQHADIIGQVLEFRSFPRSALDKVRTAWNPSLSTDSTGTMANATAGSSSVGLGQYDQFSGSATSGIPTEITYAGGANKLVIVNLIGR